MGENASIGAEKVRNDSYFFNWKSMSCKKTLGFFKRNSQYPL